MAKRRYWHALPEGWDGIHVFDSLDEAARHLGVTNVSGREPWALETDRGLVPLTELTASI